MAQGWVKRTPPYFIFTVKAWQKFTHPAKLGAQARATRDQWEPFDQADVARFSDGIAPLAESGRLGALLFQYPASFIYDNANIERLEAALATLGFAPKAVELRHRSWSDRRVETEALLQRLHATWAFIDEPKFASSVKQELTAGGDLSYLRLHGRNQQKWWKHQDAWERYDYFYRADAICRLAEKLQQLSGKAPKTNFYVFFNNHARGQAVANALMLRMALQPDVSTQLPPALKEAFPELANFKA